MRRHSSLRARYPTGCPHYVDHTASTGNPPPGPDGVKLMVPATRNRRIGDLPLIDRGALIRLDCAG